MICYTGNSSKEYLTALLRGSFLLKRDRITERIAKKAVRFFLAENYDDDYQQHY